MQIFGPLIRAFRRGAIVAAAAAILAAGATPASAQQDDGHRAEAALMVTLTNRVRSAVGEPNLIVRDDLVALACEWADKVQADHNIGHSPYIFDRDLLASRVGRDWSVAGENVGSGSDVYVIHGALVGSPTHYRNLVEPEFAYVGICIRNDRSGNLYVVQEFLSAKVTKARKAKK